MLDRLALEAALNEVGGLLADRGEHHEIVAIGGGALAILGLIDRSTQDLDLVALIRDNVLATAEPMPPGLQAAIEDVARVRGLPAWWMNSVATAMLRLGLPDGMLERTTRRDYGALAVRFIARIDQIYFKVYAAADGRPGDKHHEDLRLLAPTREELVAAATWARTHDPSDGFLMMMRGVLASFGVELGDG